jgi:hypothetical protein
VIIDENIKLGEHCDNRNPSYVHTIEEVLLRLLDRAGAPARNAIPSRLC